MTQAPTLSLRVERVSYGDVPALFAPPIMQALGRGEVPAGLPLLAQNALLPTEDSPWVDRPALASALAESNRALGNPLPQSTVDAIEGDGVFVITGQQPGLLGGPMYSVLKAITAIRHAADLSAQTGHTVLPAFWIASEDHDIEEVNHATIGSRTFTCTHEQLTQGGPRPPVGRLSLKPWRDELLGFVEQALPGGAARDEVVVALREANFENYTTLFATLMTWLFGEGRLIFVDPMQLRPQLAPALLAIAQQADALHEAFTTGSQVLRDAGHEPQLERIACFVFDADGHRNAVDFDATLADVIRADPHRVSPGAALRPIVQDAALPVIATVGGPGEMKYLWQIDPLYAAAGVRRSALLPRVCTTLVDQRTVDRAARFGLTGPAVLTAPDRLRAFDPAQFAQPDEQLQAIDDARGALIGRLKTLDAGGQAKLIDKAGDSINHQVDKLLDRLQNDRLSQRGIGKGELKQLANAIAPHGKPAERVVSILDWVGRFGRGLVDHLIDVVDPWSITHQLITVRDNQDKAQGDDH